MRTAHKYGHIPKVNWHSLKPYTVYKFKYNTQLFFIEIEKYGRFIPEELRYKIYDTYNRDITSIDNIPLRNLKYKELNQEELNEFKAGLL